MENKLTYGGEIACFPTEVVNKMLERQFEQTGKKDVSIFEENKDQNKDSGGFDWDLTPEDGKFWVNVIDDCDFERFFDKYPKENKVQVKETPNFRELAKQYAESIGFNIGDECSHRIAHCLQLGKIAYFSTEFTEKELIDEFTVYAFFEDGSAQSLAVIYQNSKNRSKLEYSVNDGSVKEFPKVATHEQTVVKFADWLLNRGLDITSSNPKRFFNSGGETFDSKSIYKLFDKETNENT